MYSRYPPNLKRDFSFQTALRRGDPNELEEEKATGGLEEALTGWLRYLEKGLVCANVEDRTASVALAPAAVEDVLLAASNEEGGAFSCAPQELMSFHF